ncbi:hypothetical protein BDV25DRAFT_172201 [Aspergillus avenaceus]|uniref:Zn(2)-C6 fungal-type domain-containing protein n=1 Tax=Aspergillus avenaceus TaxID=36643 RepID=A0A5N6TVR2_ASPAV|nr:hypothetical protein BDV25DRAFT_172201 [Aspergillus avenaceus]
MTESTRKRSRIACVSCQSRKRKCSGDQPCSTCLQFGVDCQYDLLSRKKKDTRSFRPQLSVPPLSATTAREEPVPKSHRKDPATPSASLPYSSLEANSGAAFVRKLALKIDPANAPRLHLFAWNVGTRHPLPPPMNPPPTIPAVSIVDIVSQDKMRLLATTYFEKVDPCYGFISRDYLYHQVGRRWLPPTAENALSYGPYDAVLCGVAAFGFLFSRRQATPAEYQLAEAARLILDQYMLADASSSVEIITAWVLRVAYLRMTVTPDFAWMASCSLMHLVEATDLHREPSPDTTLALTSQLCDPEVRRRLFCMARHLNVWISFELGRSRVVLHGASSVPPAPRPTGEIFNLLPVSESLDPNKVQDSSDLESIMFNVLEVVHTLPPNILAQCNLMLCIYRRLRTLDFVISGSILDRVLALSKTGLQAARTMVASLCPWHHIANVPFQIICTLLSIDSRASLALLGEAMQTLREVVLAYDTDVMREAYNTAYLLILLHNRRKEEDTNALRDVLRANGAGAAPRMEISEPIAEPNHSLADYPGFSWLSDLVVDMPSLQNFDLEGFMATDATWPLAESGV